MDVCLFKCKCRVWSVTVVVPGCFWSWPRWGRQGPVWSGRSPGPSGSSTPPLHTCLGSDTARPDYSAAWQHQGGPSPAPDTQKQTHPKLFSCWRHYQSYTDSSSFTTHRWGITRLVSCLERLGLMKSHLLVKTATLKGHSHRTSFCILLCCFSIVFLCTSWMFNHIFCRVLHMIVCSKC